MLSARPCWPDCATVLLMTGDQEVDAVLRCCGVRLGFGSTILPVGGVDCWLRVICGSVTFRGLTTKGWAEVPLDLIETPSMEVMMVAGAPWRCVSGRGAKAGNSWRFVSG